MEEEKWNDCDGIGTIKVYSNGATKNSDVEIIDDYDERMRGESQWKDERW